MSTPFNYNHDAQSRFDSVVSLPSSLSPQPSRTGISGSMDSNVTMDSMSTQSGPWSQHNPRYAPHEHDFPRSDEDAHLHHHEQPHCTSVPTSAPRASSPPSVVRCAECGVQFSGQYQRGNLVRHLRHIHGCTQYVCNAPGCEKVFRRTDARLKHTRQQHPDLLFEASAHMSSEMTTEGSQVYGPTLSRLSTNRKDAADVDTPTEIKAMLHNARMVLTALHNVHGEHFIPYVYQELAQWDWLHTDKSENYHTYRERTEDIKIIASAVAVEAGEWTTDGCDIRSQASQRNAARGKVNPTPGPGASSRHSKDRVGKNNGRPIRDKASSQEAVSTQDDIATAEIVFIGCPCHQRWLLWGGEHGTMQKPCHGCSKTFMSEVRTHLKPVRGPRNHSDWFQYYHRCQTCKVDFIREDAYHVHLRRCRHRTMSHYDILAQWIPLFCLIFPDDNVVPSPYVGNTTPLTHDEVRPYLPHPVDNTPSSNRFLGQHPVAQGGFQPPHSAFNSSGDGTSTAVMDHLLDALVRPTFPGLNTPSMPTPADFGADRTAPQTWPLHGHGNNDHLWQDFIDSTQTAFDEEIRPLLAQPVPSEAQYTVGQTQLSMSNFSTPSHDPSTPALYQWNQSTKTRSSSQLPLITTNLFNHGSSQYGGSQYNDTYEDSLHHTPNHSHNYVPSFSTPVHTQLSPSAYLESSSATTMSTQNSTQGFESTSSRYFVSNYTSPTSNLETSNSVLLSPFSMQRSISFHSAGVPETPCLRHTRPSNRSLQESYRYASNNAMVPALTMPNSPRQSFFNPQLEADEHDTNVYFRRSMWKR